MAIRFTVIITAFASTVSARAPAWSNRYMPKITNNTITVNRTYEDIAINGVEPVTVYQPVKYNQELKYDGWYAYSYPEELQHLPIPRPYGNIITVRNNGSTIMPVHLYSKFSSIKPISAVFAIMLDTNSINTIPVQGRVIVKAYKKVRTKTKVDLSSGTFPEEWKDVVLLEFPVEGEGDSAFLSGLISDAQASFNQQAFIPDVVTPGTIGFLMDNFYFSYEAQDEVGGGRGSGAGRW